MFQFQRIYSTTFGFVCKRTLSTKLLKEVALITGASSGIGRATAQLFAKNNYKLSLTGRDKSALEQVQRECVEAGMNEDEILLTATDITLPGSSEKIIGSTLEAFGMINTLINSAGILVRGAVNETPIEEYDRQMEVNVRSVVNLTRLSLPHIIKSKGTVVNVSSVCGPNAYPGVTYYCMSKAALDQFTKCLALEMGPYGVRVNSVCPGVIRTQCHQRSGFTAQEYQDYMDRGVDTHALGRVGAAREVAEGILFLAGGRSSFTTGDLLTIDGGRGIMHPR